MTNLYRRSLLRHGAMLGIASLLGVRVPKAARAAEQTLMLYNGQHPRTTQALVDAFTKATGIKVDVRKGGSSQLANQIIEEGAHSPADIFYAEESPPVAALAGRGLLAPLDPDTLTQLRPGYAAKDGTWTAVSARCRVVAYNPALIQENDLPLSIMDMTSEKWRDKVAFVPTSGAFQEQLIAIKLLKGRPAALAWLKGLKEVGRIYNGNMSAMKAVENGEIATALVNNYYWYVVAAEVGEANMKSRLHYVGHKDPGALITVSAAGVLKSSKNQALAQKLAAFMVSEPGQEAVVGSVAEYPLRPGVKSPFALKPFDELDPPPVSPADLGDASDALALRREAGLA
jgi:iron(III) transport system substrate-binding protein